MSKHFLATEISRHENIAVLTCPVENPRVALKLPKDLIMGRYVEPFLCKMRFQLVRTKVAIQ